MRYLYFSTRSKRRHRLRFLDEGFVDRVPAMQGWGADARRAVASPILMPQLSRPVGTFWFSLSSVMPAPSAIVSISAAKSLAR